MATIIAKNQTAGDLVLDNLSVPDGIIPASSQVTLTESNYVYEIQADSQLRDYVTVGDVIINNGVGDLTQTESLNFLSTQTLAYSPADVDTFIQQNSPTQTVTVAISGGQFTSVAAAVASITDASITKPYMVLVHPGEYTESPFSMKPYVSVVGVDGFYSVHIKTNNNSAHFITGDAGSELLNVSLTGPTGVGYATIDYQTASMVPFMLDHVLIRGGYYGVWCHPATRGVIHAFFVTDWYSGNTINQLFRATAYGNITCMNSAKMSGPAGSCVTGWYGSGPHAEFTLDLCAFRDANGTAFFADDGAYYRLTACTVSKASKALHIGSTGTASEFQAIGCVINEAEVTTHIQTDTPDCVIEYQGSAWSSRFNLASGTDAFILATDTDALAVTVVGELRVGELANAVPVGSYLRKTSSTASTTFTTLSRGAGRVLNVGAGTGFISDGSSIVEVTWGAATPTLTANSTAWIIVDSAGVVQEVLTEPDYEAVVVLAITTTDATDIIFLSRHYVAASQHLPHMHEYFETVLGPLSVSGCTTIKHASPSLQLDVDGGIFYIAENEFTASANAPITFTYWYRDGGTGWKWVTGQTAISATQYDDGSGTLASLTGTNFRRDTVFIISGSWGTDYHVVLGQEQFASALLAVVNPTPPEQLRVNSLRVAAVVVQKDATDLTSVIDQRPILGQLSTGTTAVTAHGSLSGLGADDHTQYQLRTEKDTANGYAGLTAGTQIATAQLPFTATPPVNVTKAAAAVGTATEIARQDHKHDVTTAAPAATGVATTSGEGSATSLARSDHSHQSNTAPANVTKAAAAIGTSGEPARADHKHDITTATPGTTTFGAAVEGSATSLSRSDHAHALTAPSAPADVTKAAASAGASANVAREDHKHDVSTAAAVAVGTANAEGSATSLARSDHTHQVTGLTIASQAQGDILYFNGTSWVRLAPGTAGQRLQTNGAGADPSWTTPSVFGNNFQYAATEARTTTTSATFQIKTTLTTPTLTGTYRIGWTAELDSSDTTVSFEVRLWDATNGVVLGVSSLREVKDTTDTIVVHNFMDVTFTAEARILQLQWRSESAGITMGIQAARIEIWRVS